MMSSSLKLHIVSFDIPFPPDYGGAIDVFYKVKNLSEAGVEVYLHCPDYGRPHSDELNKICKKVWYYNRKSYWNGISLKLPYMVYSRRHKDMLKNLLAIEAPVLFDGINGAYYLNHPSLAHRFKILRNQNLEHDYFGKLAKREKNIFKKCYYSIESFLLRRFENRLFAADAFCTVALHDYHFFKEKYPDAIHEYIPSFQPYNEVCSKTGTGNYALYHGNLSHAENKEVVEFLIKEIIPKLDYDFIITGKNPPDEMIEQINILENCRIIPNPSAEEMHSLIENAHIHLLPTFQDTGLKLKLLLSLFHGRHVIVNKSMVHGTGLSQVCILADNADEIIRQIDILKSEAFTEADIQQRKNCLSENYDNRKNAQRLRQLLQQKSL